MTESEVALVTGAGRGIGAAVAQKLAAEGYAVGVNDIDEEKARETAEEIEQAAGAAFPVGGDVSSESDVEMMVSQILEEYGRIDVLVNNAGIQTEAPFLELKQQEWDDVIDTNLNGVFQLSQRVANEMVEQGIEGAIVNITSIHQDIPRKEKNHYDVSKAGAWMLTKDMALELGEHHINVNAVAPGAIKTPMNNDLLESEELREEVNEKTPWDRMGEPEEIADAVSFLVSDDAEYITGSYIRVDGGRSLV